MQEDLFQFHASILPSYIFWDVYKHPINVYLEKCQVQGEAPPMEVLCSEVNSVEDAVCRKYLFPSSDAGKERKQEK